MLIRIATLAAMIALAPAQEEFHGRSARSTPCATVPATVAPDPTRHR